MCRGGRTAAARQSPVPLREFGDRKVEWPNGPLGSLLNRRMPGRHARSLRLQLRLSREGAPEATPRRRLRPPAWERHRRRARQLRSPAALPPPSPHPVFRRRYVICIFALESWRAIIVTAALAWSPSKLTFSTTTWRLPGFVRVSKMFFHGPLYACRIIGLVRGGTAQPTHQRQTKQATDSLFTLSPLPATV